MLKTIKGDKVIMPTIWSGKQLIGHYIFINNLKFIYYFKIMSNEFLGKKIVKKSYNKLSNYITLNLIQSVYRKVYILVYN